MLKRILAVIVVSCLLPVMAHAATWSLSTWVKSAGGSLQVESGTLQTSTNGKVFKNYTSSGIKTVKIFPNSGYTTTSVVYNGTTLTNPAQTSFAMSGPTTQSLYVTFSQLKYSISASVAGNAGGTVSPANIANIAAGTVFTTPKVFIFTPAAFYKLDTITGIPAGASQSPAVPLAGQQVTVTFPAGFTVTSNIILVGTFSNENPIAKAGNSQSVIAGIPVTLDGSGTLPGTAGISSYAWTQTSGPEVTLSNSATAIAGFTPTVAGSYNFSLTVMPGGSTASTTVTVFADANSLVIAECQNCHSAAGVGVAGNVYGKWSASSHNSKGVVCSRCHVGADTGGHPGNLRKDSVSETTFNYTGSAGNGNFCVTCHSPAIPTEFTASKHSIRAGSASCSFCHVGGVHNPNTACVDCHNPGSPYGLPWPPTGLEFHNEYSGTNLCSNCHNRHNPKTVTGMSGAAHYNNITSAGFPASYVTSKSVCANCHVSNETNATIRHQWAKSGHAAFTDLPWTAYDFKTRSGCVQCHTTTGFISYSTGRVTAAWGVTTDKTKEVLACNGCHSDVENGAVRTVNPVKPFVADTYVNRNIGPSNICMNCHSGRNNGLSITSADFTTQTFIAPHYLAAGSILHGKGGYIFPGQSYAFYSSNSHRVIGLGNSSGTGTAGPCIGCHMTASQKHLFKAVSSVTGGLVGKITTSTCANCHGSSYINDLAKINNSQSSYKDSLEVLNQTLIYRNFLYTTDYPYFSNTDWGTGQEGASSMGAAFNYVLLKKEPGGYAHNPGYAKKLIFDSIDYLYNGSITGSIEGALAYLVQHNKIDQEIADRVSAYKEASSCTSCHDAPPRTGAHLVHTDGVGATYGDDGNNSTVTSYRFNCGSCHPVDISKHANGIVDMELFNPAATGTKKSNPANAGRTGTGTTTVCLNVYCHSSGQEDSVRKYIDTPQWGGYFSLNKCASCHGDPPNYASGGPENANANSHYSQNVGSGEGGHLVSLHFDNIRKDPVDSWQPLFPKAGSAGSGSGHGDPATSTTISCPTCHASTVSLPSMQSAPGTAFDCASCHGLQPAAVIADKSMHVNGARDVYFMTGTFRSRAQIRLDNFTSVIKPLGWTRNNGYKTMDSFDSVPFSGSYNPADKSCVTACHLNQPAKWGDTALNCISCHADL